MNPVNFLNNDAILTAAVDSIEKHKVDVKEIIRAMCVP
jgi:hypothetical protein